MISQRNRFHGHGSLKFLFSKGKTIRTPYFALKHVYNPKRRDCRVAVVVSKKVDKRAVVRNRIRRRLYELVRKNMPAHLTNHDIALIVYDNKIATTPHDKLEPVVIKALNQLH